ncbi:MAG: FkbM family methyltransferase [Saprospiraceae bacterium]|nr:FkbM family methyltransferase [Saprospiraceae bacterium]
MKTFLKKLIKKLPIAFTQNQKYDWQTRQVLQKVCKPDCNCIDIGCHKGEIMDLFIQYAPQGIHLGFEPIPEMYQALREKYTPEQAHIFPYALSDDAGKTTFNYVVSNPAYSGIKKRKYDHAGEVDREITVEKERLDNLVGSHTKISLIKIDVEGGEYQVLKGATGLLADQKPLVIFEHGIGGSDFYGTKPGDVYRLFEGLGYQLFTMKSWLAKGRPFDLKEFERQYEEKLNYYFLAEAKQ